MWGDEKKHMGDEKKHMGTIRSFLVTYFLTYTITILLIISTISISKH